MSVAADIADAASARHRGHRRLLRRHRAGPPHARPDPAAPAAGGEAGRGRGRPDPPRPGLERGAVGPDLTAAQLLLTLDDTEDRRRYLNARATLNTLLGLGCVPVINENDTVATAEIRFGDNDRLAARVAEMVQADQLILLSDIDGLYTADPRRDPAAAHIPVVPAMTAEIEAMGGEPPPGYSSGGMRTKLVAARIATQAGCAMAIALGHAAAPAAGAWTEGARCTWFLPTPDGPLGAQALDRRQRCRRSARSRWMPVRRVRSAAGARCCRPACARLTGTSSAAMRSSCGPDGAALGRGLSAYGSEDARAHHRPSLRGDRGHPGLARPRRDHPSRRSGAGIGIAG